MNKRSLSILCLVAMFISVLGMLGVSSAEYVMEKPVDPDMWEEPHFDTDHAYSFAFVGDTQYITCGDAYLGTKKLKYQYKYIADTAKERKLEHVFVLGDITDRGYRNDGNLAGTFYSVPKLTEWRVAKEAISQLDNTDVTYSLCRGNHDDYIIDYFFNVPEYTDRFEGVGGFFIDADAKWTDIEGVDKSREADNPEAYVYWDSLTGMRHEETIVNSWMTKEICGTKYLFITIDFNPTDKVLDWVNETLAAYPDHRAIITTHAYLGSKGDLIKDDKGNTMYLFGNSGDEMWEKVLRKHKNVFMVVSGHVGVTDLVYSYQTGDHGNKVLQVLVDPQSYDAKDSDSGGKIESGIQDTGLVLYMNFSADGKKITFDYYSTLLGKFIKNNDYTFYVDDHTHTWNEGYIVSLPTNKLDGSKIYTCVDCGETKTIVLQRLGKTDARFFEAYGQKHHYLGDAITGEKPNASDGKVSTGEYSYSYEYSPSSPKDTVTVDGNKVNGYTDTEWVKTYMSYDSDYFYLALETKDRVYCPDQDHYMINLGLRNGGRTLDAVSRLRYTFSGDASKGVLVGQDVGSNVGMLLKNEDGSWRSNNEGVTVGEHVPERSLCWDEKKGTLTLELKFDIRAMLDYWKNDCEPKDAILYFYPIVSMYGDSAKGAGDAPKEQGLLWYYFDNTKIPSLNESFKAEYPNTNYTMSWFPHIVHFSHKWDNGAIASESTHLEHGIINYTCLNCDAVKTEKLVTVPHEFVGDFTDYDDDYHSRKCECGEIEKVAHVYESGSCTVCGHVYVEKTEPSTTTSPIVTEPVTTPAGDPVATGEGSATTADRSSGCRGAIELSLISVFLTLGSAIVLKKKRYG